MDNRGILLVQPEHILSFKLMSIECTLADRSGVGRSLLYTQQFFDSNSRDIVDESDENFSVKFELIYTIGMQGPVELSPERWSIIQVIVGLAGRYAAKVKHTHPESIDLDNRWEGGRFPRLRILKDDANTMLLDLIAKHVCDKGIEGLHIGRQLPPMRKAVFRYITGLNLTETEIHAVEQSDFWTDLTHGPLLLLRGLIAGGILSFVFGAKRWRVNYGIDPTRKPDTKLAVPFRSKDSPTPRSEFSHPDVVIALTSLCYYYSGLNDDELFDTFTYLLKSDGADIEYGLWTRLLRNLPEAFRHLTGINIKDRYQCINEVFPALRYSKGVIDYFLSHVVFPKEMKEFPKKLSASGWDIGQVKPHPTTGFSGTSDSRHVLPLSVKHLDLPTQKHTNALVLAYLLRNENSVELLPSRPASIASDAEHLLTTVNSLQQTPRVILDVGAQILELNNYEIAKKWLDISDPKTTQAVVYCNDYEELTVVDRKGYIESLQTSPFSKQLDVCLIYLDEAHTRGTDVKLPRDYRAAVTLGAKVTKDKLVQGKSPQ